jgi:hypothetical protein
MIVYARYEEMGMEKVLLFLNEARSIYLNILKFPIEE